MKTLEVRFWEKVNKEGPLLVPKLGRCWEWTSHTVQGYGRFSYLGKNRLAHHISCILSGRTISCGGQLDHLCRNRKCVRPKHLEAVSNQINSQRGAKSTLTPTTVKRIRTLYKSRKFTYRSLATHLSTGKGAVDFVLRGLTWNNVK